MESWLLMLILLTLITVLCNFGIKRLEHRWCSGTRNSFNQMGEKGRQDFTDARITSGAECRSSSAHQWCGAGTGTEESFNNCGEGQQLFRGAIIQSGAINRKRKTKGIVLKSKKSLCKLGEN